MGNQQDQRITHYWDSLECTHTDSFFSWAWHSKDWGDWGTKALADWRTDPPEEWGTRGLAGPAGLGGMLRAPLLLLVPLVPLLPRP